MSDRRKGTYTFCDQKLNVFTVRNVPSKIELPQNSTPDTNLEENKSYGKVLRPLVAHPTVLELPYVLKSIPADDVLLSRIAVNPTALVPVQYADGWGLPPQTANSWSRLEKGLLLIADTLLSLAASHGNCGFEIARILHGRTHWSPPVDFGYRRTHRTFPGALAAIRRSHLAFALLSARVSFAIAIWDYAEKVSATRTAVPRWIDCLLNSGVPSSWVDTLQQSVLVSFTLGLRVGVALHASDRHWMPLLSVLDYTNVPIIIYWRDEKDVMSFRAQYPHFKHLSPPALRVVETAKEDADKFKQLTGDAAKSGAYLYPFKVNQMYYCLQRAGLTAYRAYSSSLLTAVSGSHCSPNWHQRLLLAWVSQSSCSLLHMFHSSRSSSSLLALLQHSQPSSWS